MTISLCTDEHVPSVFITALRSNGFDVVTAKRIFGEATDDRTLLEYCAKNDRVLVTHDKKDFGGTVGDEVDHDGIIIYTDPTFPRSAPGGAVRALERVLEHYSPADLAGERVWLDQWRDPV